MPGARAETSGAGVVLLGPFSAEQRDDHRKMIEVNLLGAVTAAEVFPDRIEDGGDVVNISSVAGRVANPGSGVYAATGFGVDGWSEPLRKELLPDVRVTVIAEVVTFVLGRPRHLAVDEILLRPAGQQLQPDGARKPRPERPCTRRADPVLGRLRRGWERPVRRSAAGRGRCRAGQVRPPRAHGGEHRHRRLRARRRPDGPIVTLGTGSSLFFDHRDPQMAARLAERRRPLEA